LASQAWLDQLISHKTNGQHDIVITPKKQSFFNNHALLLFYASTCPHCHSFAPLLKAWATENQAQVLTLAFDNQPLPEFPNFKPATTEWVNVAFNGRPITYPALFVVNHQTKMIYPVSFGSLSANELAVRMTDLIEKINQYEHQGDSV